MPTPPPPPLLYTVLLIKTHLYSFKSTVIWCVSDSVWKQRCATCTGLRATCTGLRACVLMFMGGGMCPSLCYIFVIIFPLDHPNHGYTVPSSVSAHKNAHFIGKKTKKGLTCFFCFFSNLDGICISLFSLGLYFTVWQKHPKLILLIICYLGIQFVDSFRFVVYVWWHYFSYWVGIFSVEYSRGRIRFLLG